MIKDKIVIGSIAGMIADIFKDLSNIIWYKLGIVKILYINLAASTHLSPADVYTPVGWVIGILADLITGGAIGVVTLLFFVSFGLDHWWYKGLIIGNVVWLFGLGVILNLGAIHLSSLSPNFRLTALLDHQLFGLILAFIIYRYYRKLTVKKGK